MIIRIFEKKKPDRALKEEADRVTPSFTLDPKTSIVYQELERKYAELKRDYDVLSAERMGDDYSRRKALRLMDVSIADPIPTDVDQRKAYVREVAQFFSVYGEKKLMQMISFVREELDWSGLIDSHHSKEALNGMSRQQYDWLMRGTSNAFKLLLDWGNIMQGEHAANIEAEKEAIKINSQ